ICPDVVLALLLRKRAGPGEHGWGYVDTASLPESAGVRDEQPADPTADLDRHRPAREMILDLPQQLTGRCFPCGEERLSLRAAVRRPGHAGADVELGILCREMLPVAQRDRWAASMRPYHTAATSRSRSPRSRRSPLRSR